MKILKELDNKIKIAICIVLVMFIGVFVYLSNPVNKVNCLIATHNYQKAVTYYNNKLNSSQRKKIHESMNKEIREIETQCLEGKLEYENAKVALIDFSKVEDLKIKDKAKTSLAYMTVEYIGNQALNEMKSLLEKEDYIAAMKEMAKVDKSYSEYQSIQSYYQEAKEKIFAKIGSPSNKEEYRLSIQRIESYIQEIFDPDFIQMRDDLIRGFDIFTILTRATDSYEKQEYKKAFDQLEEGLLKYPDNEKIKYALSAYQFAYMMDIIEQSVYLAEQGKDKQVVQIVENAIKVYDCEQFQQLLYEAKMKSDILFATKEKLSDASVYVLKSGKKLVLGDFEEDEQETLLSLGGSIAAAAVNLDLPLDVRDLSYDISHWGEGQYFEAKLALDFIGVIPIIGSIKYLDNMADVGKKTSNIIDSADVISDVKKQTQSVQDSLRKGDDITEIVKHGEYKKVTTKNEYLKNHKHSTTHVKFVEQKITLPDGQKISGVFPRFKSEYTCKIPEEMYKLGDKEQMKLCNKKLYEKINTNPKLRKRFSKDQIDQIKEGMRTGAAPEGYVWHHEAAPGEMSLVDAEIHSKTGHTGGRSIWGGGDERR